MNKKKDFNESMKNHKNGTKNYLGDHSELQIHNESEKKSIEKV